MEQNKISSFIQPQFSKWHLCARHQVRSATAVLHTRGLGRKSDMSLCSYPVFIDEKVPSSVEYQRVEVL